MGIDDRIILKLKYEHKYRKYFRITGRQGMCGKFGDKIIFIHLIM